MSRKVRGSRNRAKATMKVRRLHARIANVRNDHLHKLSSAIGKSHAVVTRPAYRNTVVISGKHNTSARTNSCSPMKGRKPLKMSGNVMCGGATDLR